MNATNATHSATHFSTIATQNSSPLTHCISPSKRNLYKTSHGQVLVAYSTEMLT